VPRRLRHRFWIEGVLASAAGVLAIVSLFWHDWIETIFGIDPDRGSGSAEWLVVVSLATIMVIFVCAARLEWRRAVLGEG
jgi:undecaprenyl pyrophosphate phosphatase UppP